MRSSTYAGLILFAAAAACGAYAGHFRNGFHFDDWHAVVNNTAIRSLDDWPRFFRDAGAFSIDAKHQSFRPLTTLTLAVDYALAGGIDDPFFFQLSTFVVFLGLGLVALALFRRIAESCGLAADGRLFAVAAVLWYWLHPANAETVNYVIQRADVQSTFGVVASLALYACAPRLRRAQLHLLPAALGVLAKAPAAMYAPILLLYDLLVERDVPLTEVFAKSRRVAVLASLRAAAPAFVVCGAVFAWTESRHGEALDWGGSSRLLYAATQLWILVRYVGAFLLPIDLSADHDLRAFSSVFDLRVGLGAACVCALLAAAVLASRRRAWRPVTLGVLWFFLALAPTSSFIPLAEVRNDHRAFFPYVGLTLAAAGVVALAVRFLAKACDAVDAGRPFRRITAAVVLSYFAACAGGVVARCEVWRNEETLWRDAVNKSPESGRNWMQLGVVQMRLGRFNAALASFERSKELWPLYSLNEINLGIVKGALGRGVEAERHFRRAGELNSGDHNAPFYFGRWLFEQGRLEEASSQLELAITRAPEWPDPQRTLLEVEAQRRRWGRVGEIARRILARDPRDADALRRASEAESPLAKAESAAEAAPTAPALVVLSAHYFKAGRHEDAARAARRATELDPASSDAWCNLGAAFGAMSRWDEEIDACERALKLDPRNELARNNLAWAKSQRGAATRKS